MIPQPDYIDQLIARSTGLLGDFRMPVCIMILSNEGAHLDDSAIRRILKRYRDHVEFWNVNYSTASAELDAFAQAVHRNLYDIRHIFDSLRWIGIVKHDPGMDFTIWTRPLHDNGIEFKSQYNAQTRKGYVLVRKADYPVASAVISSQVQFIPPSAGTFEIGLFEDFG